MNEDPRKTGLKSGLRQLTKSQIQKVIDWPHEMVLDTWNYHDGKFCPLAVALDLQDLIENPSHEKVYSELISRGYKVYNTRGIKGEFYTTHRKEDLIEAAREVLSETENTVMDEIEMPICKKCGKEFIFDQEEPFAYCDCGTTEWGYTGDVFRDIQKRKIENS